MKNKIKTCLASLLIIILVFANSSNTSAAHTHKWKFDYAETEYYEQYSSGYHKESRILHYYCICGKTKTLDDKIYTVHRYVDGICKDCGY